MFLLMPFIVWMFDSSVSSEASFDSFTQAFSGGLVFLPGWGVKLLVWAVIGAYLVHFIAGLRHLWMDVTHRVSKEQGRGSALSTLVMSASLWLLLGAKLFGLY